MGLLRKLKSRKQVVKAEEILIEESGRIRETVRKYSSWKRQGHISEFNYQPNGPRVYFSYVPIKEKGRKCTGRFNSRDRF